VWLRLIFSPASEFITPFFKIPRALLFLEKDSLFFSPRKIKSEELKKKKYLITLLYDDKKALEFLHQGICPV
jgi:hypothetical protein